MSNTPLKTVGIPQKEQTRQGLFYLAVGMTVALLAMLTLGILIATGTTSLQTMHGIIGYFSLLLGIAGAVAGWRFAKLMGRMGIFWHAVSIPVLMVLQIGLAEMGQAHVHMALGVAILLAVIGLVMMTRKPVATV